ncbi:phosphoadenosine phosphosulfate reductase family protein [Falsirhodobacter algicola]|uniref:Phosphoadenosine phosphosulfate reductase family protein n=1 Tax=Falsirhodobacter algicola TaxID=2692330 RepID=A0A8J8SM73_9RHOB|nr:phosphoadenosine phosphosulfate reductase family protein [Falsirhodobacter algicola]QUS37106.1 phosphoadenosine phosphosulfate reductase family protein [Falsirhodobacter algicola]
MTPTSLSDAVQDRSRRHIIPLSGGKDSTALAVYMLEHHGDLPLEFVFTDTGAELPETYSYLRRFEAIFGVQVNRLTALDLPELQVRSKAGRRSPFDVLLNEVYSGFLPNPQARWCTRMLKIKPFEHFVGGDEAYSYIGIRADENREGFRGAAAKPAQASDDDGVETGRAKPVVLSNRNNIVPVYPLKDIGFGLDDVRELLLGCGLGLPPYYDWRSRSGCYFCFYQQVGEWQGLKERHPELFEAAKTYEAPKANGRCFTWSQTRSLEELEKLRERYATPIGEPEDGCAICHL